MIEIIIVFKFFSRKLGFVQHVRIGIVVKYLPSVAKAIRTDIVNYLARINKEPVYGWADSRVVKIDGIINHDNSFLA